MKLPFAKDHAPIEQLVDVVTTIKPTAIIGLFVRAEIIQFSGDIGTQCKKLSGGVLAWLSV